MKRRKIAALLFVSAILFFSVSASAEELEEPKLKQGYYIQVAPFGSMELSPTSSGLKGPWFGPGFTVRLGEALNDWFDLGAGGGVAFGLSDDYRSLYGHFSVELTVKPSDYFFVQAGAGLGFTDFTGLGSDAEKIIGRFGASYTIMVGYDFFIAQTDIMYKSGGWALTPVVGFQLGPSEPTSTYAVFAGVAVTWWSGLAKNRLKLPLSEAF